MLNVGLLVLDQQEQVIKKDSTLPISLIEPDFWKLHLSSMVHSVVGEVFDEMTGLCLKPQK